MDISEYQREAKATDLTAGSSTEGLVIAVLGLVSEAGSIANVVKKNLRDNISNETRKEFLAIELGDVLWYLSNVASRLGLKLDDIARENLERTRSRHGTADKWNDEHATKSFEAGFPATQRFPRRMLFQFEEHQEGDRTLVAVRLLRAEPNAFPKGALKDEKTGKPVGFTVGNSLTDNSARDDGYRYHDIFHLGFMTVLGWSPVIRHLLRLKRKEDDDTDENQDGARARDTEEGISAYLAQRAEKFDDFQSPRNVDNPTIDYVLEQVKDLEVAERPAWLWKEAISRAFVVWKEATTHHGGYVLVDLDKRELSFSTILPS